MLGTAPLSDLPLSAAPPPGITAGAVGAVVCGTAAVSPRTGGTASLDPRTGGTAGLSPRTGGTAGLTEC